MDPARITEILTDPATLEPVERQPITQLAYAAQHAGFEQQVGALYDSMVRVVVTPTWVRLIDFQRTAPRAVERLVQAKQG
jgi:hypothetical protein